MGRDSDLHPRAGRRAAQAPAGDTAGHGRSSHATGAAPRARLAPLAGAVGHGRVGGHLLGGAAGV
jgi:hypothetical protein